MFAEATFSPFLLGSVGLSEEDSSSSVRRAGVTQTDKDKRDEFTGETTSAVTRADFVTELAPRPTVGPDSAACWVEGLPMDSALLLVKRGPNAGSRFVLNQAVTSAGRHPISDIFLCLLYTSPSPRDRS